MPNPNNENNKLDQGQNETSTNQGTTALPADLVAYIVESKLTREAATDTDQTGTWDTGAQFLQGLALLALDEKYPQFTISHLKQIISAIASTDTEYYIKALCAVMPAKQIDLLLNEPLLKETQNSADKIILVVNQDNTNIDTNTALITREATEVEKNYIEKNIYSRFELVSSILRAELIGVRNDLISSSALNEIGNALNEMLSSIYNTSPSYNKQLPYVIKKNLSHIYQKHKNKSDIVERFFNYFFNFWYLNAFTNYHQQLTNKNKKRKVGKTLADIFDGISFTIKMRLTEYIEKPILTLADNVNKTLTEESNKYSVTSVNRSGYFDSICAQHAKKIGVFFLNIAKSFTSVEDTLLLNGELLPLDRVNHLKVSAERIFSAFLTSYQNKKDDSHCAEELMTLIQAGAGLSQIRDKLDGFNDEYQQRFIFHKVDYYVNQRCKNGLTPFIAVVRTGNLPSVRMLLQSYGANPKLTSSNENSPLHHAIECNDISIFKELLLCDIDINATNKNQETPLATAYRMLGENVNHPVKTEITKQIITILTEKKAEFLLKDSNGHTPLMRAIIDQKVELTSDIVKSIEKLPSQQARTIILSKDKEGNTALDHALKIKDNEIRATILILLLQSDLYLTRGETYFILLFNKPLFDFISNNLHLKGLYKKRLHSLVDYKPINKSTLLIEAVKKGDYSCVTSILNILLKKVEYILPKNINAKPESFADSMNLVMGFLLHKDGEEKTALDHAIIEYEASLSAKSDSQQSETAEQILEYMLHSPLYSNININAEVVIKSARYDKFYDFLAAHPTLSESYPRLVEPNTDMTLSETREFVASIDQSIFYINNNVFLTNTLFWLCLKKPEMLSDAIDSVFQKNEGKITSFLTNVLAAYLPQKTYFDIWNKYIENHTTALANKQNGNYNPIFWVNARTSPQKSWNDYGRIPEKSEFALFDFQFCYEKLIALDQFEEATIFKLITILNKNKENEAIQIAVKSCFTYLINSDKFSHLVVACILDPQMFYDHYNELKQNQSENSNTTAQILKIYDLTNALQYVVEHKYISEKTIQNLDNFFKRNEGETTRARAKTI